jgi:antitoxin MazE
MTDGSVVELAVQGRTLCVTSVAPPRYELDELLSRVTPENLHRGVRTGRAGGNEMW